MFCLLGVFLQYFNINLFFLLQFVFILWLWRSRLTRVKVMHLIYQLWACGSMQSVGFDSHKSVKGSWQNKPRGPRVWFSMVASYYDLCEYSCKFKPLLHTLPVVFWVLCCPLLPQVNVILFIFVNLKIKCWNALKDFHLYPNGVSLAFACNSSLCNSHFVSK